MRFAAETSRWTRPSGRLLVSRRLCTYASALSTSAMMWQASPGRQRDAERPRASKHEAQVAPIDILHDDVRPSVFEQQVEHAHQVGMVEAGGQARLVVEHRQPMRVARQRRR